MIDLGMLKRQSHDEDRSWGTIFLDVLLVTTAALLLCMLIGIGVAILASPFLMMGRSVDPAVVSAMAEESRDFPEFKRLMREAAKDGRIDEFEHQQLQRQLRELQHARAIKKALGEDK